ncbi:hypothetical protein FH039_02750 [Thermococcus indicus]|uniref:Uncharacterized protein n=1 Tax=Thermococcus indicus TaxID=2586643 RepID=A0A4Y5SK23_9EURY|nr:hypothetical protein [Thermococcus indicus]QDA30744.1 hypothetical protein FH039_02750 [Thermococcus indicus]
MVRLYSVDKLGKRRIEVKKGMFRKEIIAKDYHIFEEIPESATLEEEKIYKKHLSERLKDPENDGVRIYNATDNTHLT